MIRVVLPAHLRALASLDSEIELDAGAEPTIASALDALDAAHPVLVGTIRDRDGRRRPLVRYYACEEDLSHEPADTTLPPAVAEGREPLLVVGAMAGG